MSGITKEMMDALLPPKFADENRPASGGNDMSVADFAGSRCSACDGGVVFLVEAGEHCGSCHPCPRHMVAPWPYCKVSTIPCDCAQGVRVATKTKKLRFPEAANLTVNLKAERRKWLMDNCVFSSVHAADKFERDCRLLKEAAEDEARIAAENERRGTATPQTPARAESPTHLPVDRALRAIAANPTILPTMAEKPQRYEIPEF